MVQYQITKTEFIELLQHLLREQIVSEVLSGVEKKNRYVLSPEFVSDPDQLENFPLSQLSVYGYARSDSAANTVLHSKKAFDTSIAVVGRACDVRAMVELEKKMQLKWENLFIFTFQDVGYLPNKALRVFFKNTGIDDTTIIHERLTASNLLLTLNKGKSQEFPLGDQIDVADNCSRCIQKEHYLADFLLGTHGLPFDSQDFILTPQSKRAEDLIVAMKWEDKKIDEKLSQQYAESISQITRDCVVKREKDLKAYLTNEDRFSLLTKCTACGMCVRSCPICFCKLCNLTAQVKAKSMDKISFITTRFAHVADTCIECGRCTTNCPMNIPLDLVFQNLRDRFKNERNYEAGARRKEKVLHLNIK